VGAQDGTGEEVPDKQKKGNCCEHGRASNGIESPLFSTAGPNNPTEGEGEKLAGDPLRRRR